MEFIVDKRLAPSIYYDGDSMGMGELSVECACGHRCTIATTKIIQDHIAQGNSSLIDNFDIEVPKNQRVKLSSFECENCTRSLLLAITCGEVQSGRYQASYIFLAEQNETSTS